MSTSMYATPDGENCAQKVFHVSRNLGYFGFMYGVVHAAGIGNPKGVLAFCWQVGQRTMPMLGAGAAFSTVVCMSAHIRGKDGPLNHFFGGASMASMIGLIYGPTTGWLMAPVLGLITCVAKDAHNEGFRFVPYKNRMNDKSFGMSMSNNDTCIGPRRHYEEPTDY